MKKILAALLVLALGLPALANVDVTWADLGGGHLQIKVAPTGGAAVRGVALKLTRTAGDAYIDATTDATVTQFNTHIDYAFSNPAGYTVGSGHPLAKPDQPGALSAFPASTFCLCSGYLHASRAGVVVDSFFDIYYEISTDSTITIALDPLRGGIVGDNLNAVTVNSPATLIAGYTLTTSSTAGGNVTTPGEGAFGPYTGPVAIVASDPDAGYYWNNWTGTGVTAGKVADPTAKSTTITMDADYTAIANYQAESISTPSVALTTTTYGAYVNSGRSESFTATCVPGSSLGHTLEYKFTWGDGTDSGWVSSNVQPHTYTYAAAGTYVVTVQARCATHTSIVSSVSANYTVTRECMKSTATGYAAWRGTTWNRPTCWCYKKQCNGDADGLLELTKPVAGKDLTLFKASYGKADSALALVVINGIPGICADFEKTAELTKRVAGKDLTILKAYYGKAASLVPLCSATGQPNHAWFWTN